MDAALDEALQAAVDVTRTYTEQKDAIVDRFTRFYLQQLLARAGGNQTLAASLAGLTRGYLGRLVHKHGLGRRPPDDDADSG
jgi:DNA-binding protein Fis